jgi:hypothetical protein
VRSPGTDKRAEGVQEDDGAQLSEERMMNLSKHPILKQGYDVIQAIEECGTSEKLTHAVTLAGKLLDEIDNLVDRLMVYSALDEMVADSIAARVSK